MRISDKTSELVSHSSQPGVAECSLSDSEQLEAVKRFEELMPVFHSPRCANCHGGIDFFSPNYEQLHGGGAVEMKDGDVKGPDGTIIARKRPNFKTCQNCHDAAPGDFVWVPPHPSFDISFAGRTAGQICEQIKRHPPGHPNDFLRHIDGDELIRLGFEGKRGHTSLPPLPPPMTAEAFNTKVSDWIVAMKVQDEWPQPLSCGCVAPNVWRGTVTYQQVLDVTDEEGDYSWMGDEGLTYWTNGFPGTVKVEAEFSFDGREGYWKAKGEYGATSRCVKLTSNISGSGMAKLRVDDWDPASQEELPSVTVDTRPDGSYRVAIATGDLVGRSFYKVIASHDGEARCGESEEADESTSVAFSAQGRVDPNRPDVLSGSRVITRDGGSVKLTWKLYKTPGAIDK